MGAKYALGISFVTGLSFGLEHLDGGDDAHLAWVIELSLGLFRIYFTRLK